MTIDWTEIRHELVAEVQSQVLPSITAAGRFIGSDQFAARFNAIAAHWRPGQRFGRVMESINEIAAACAILDSSTDIVELTYEPKLANTEKTIDFRIRFRSGNTCWIDVKTVAPEWRDDDASWARFKKIAADFPPNARLEVDRSLGGAGISGQEIKARWSFITRTVEAEEKESLLAAGEKAPVRLLFCSNGPWRKDGLEDFADFYHSGRFRPDDWAQNAITRYLADENIVFARTLAGFSFLYSSWESFGIRDFEIDVRGPTMIA